MSLLWAKRGWLTPGSQTLRTLERFGASDVWDFVDNSYMRAGVVTTNAGLTVTRASSGYAQREDGIWELFGSGVLRRTDKGALIEGARTNRALHSRDLTQAAWTATNVTVARNQVGIDGLANTACSLTATAGNGTVLQAVTDTSTARYFSVWIKRITGTGTVEVTLDNGSTWTGVTVTSAYTRVGATQTLANPTVGVRLVTSGDAVAVDFAQLEDGAFPSSPIATEGTAVTRAADLVTATLSGYATAVTLFGELACTQFAGTGPRFFQWGDVKAFRQTATETRFAADASGAFAIKTGIAAGPQKVAGIYTVGAGSKMTVNGASVATGADTGVAIPAGAFYFGNVSGADRPSNDYLRRVAIFPRAFNDAELQGITT